MIKFLLNTKYNEKKYYRFITREKKKDKLKLYGLNPKFKNQEDILFELFGKCNKFNNNIKLFIISDTHGCLNENSFKEFIEKHMEYDLCVMLGDHSERDINIILKYIPKHKLYGLLGNHDYNYLLKYNIINLNGEIITINGVKLLGIEGSYKYKNEKFPSFSQRESIEFLNEKDRVDILLSHDSPFGLSERNDIAHQGLFGITYYLFKNKVSYCIHGHLHTPYKKELINGTKIECCYMLNYIEINKN